MEFALQGFESKYSIVYITDQKHDLSSNIIKIPFQTPDFFINDPVLEIANTSIGVVSWGLRNMDKIWEVYQWASQMKDLVQKTVADYQPSCVCILYPAIAFLWFLQEVNLPIYIFYYAPGLISKDVPWLFDSILKDPKYALYKERSYNQQSTKQYLNRLSLFEGLDRKPVRQVLKRAHHVLCWDPKLVPPLRFVYKSLSVIHAGALLSPLLKPVSIDLSKNNIIFMSFGSYGKAKELQKCLGKLLQILEDFCESRGKKVIFHNGENFGKHITAHSGFIQYETIVPKSCLVIFTGSACLQNICCYHAIPMLFFPLLNEQYYWAKNYKYHTGIEYIDYFHNKCEVDLEKAMKSPLAFLRKVRKNMQKASTASCLSKVLEDHNAPSKASHSPTT